MFKLQVIDQISYRHITSLCDFQAAEISSLIKDYRTELKKKRTANQNGRNSQLSVERNGLSPVASPTSPDAALPIPL